MEANKATNSIFVELCEQELVRAACEAHIRRRVARANEQLHLGDNLIIVADDTSADWLARACPNNFNIDAIEAIFASGSHVGHLDFIQRVGSVHRQIDQVHLERLAL